MDFSDTLKLMKNGKYVKRKRSSKIFAYNEKYGICKLTKFGWDEIPYIETKDITANDWEAYEYIQ